MSYSFDHMDGWELFNSPFSPSVNTAQTLAGRPQQPPEATQHNTAPTAAKRNTTPTAAQRNSSLAQPQKPPQPARRATQPQPKQPAVKEPNLAPSTQAPIPDKKPAPKAVTPAPEQTVPTKQEPTDSPKAPADTTPAPPQKELVLDMSSGPDVTHAEDDTARRKAEWESKQKAKKQAEKDALQKLNSMSNEDAIAASIKRVSADVEKITRRNMKECVAAHIQERARQDAVFARRIMHPSKSIYNCFKYINRMARAYIQQEMAENDIQPENGIYGGDVPDDMVYQFSIDYYNSDNLPEDQEKEEKFISKPYVPAPSKSAKKKEKKTKKQQEKPADNYEQMSLEGVIG